MNKQKKVNWLNQRARVLPNIQPMRMTEMKKAPQWRFF
jgi:hypothetical protein